MPIRGRYSPFNLTAFNQKLDHGLLLGLADDDHPYLSLDGEATNVTNGTFALTTTGKGRFDSGVGIGVAPTARLLIRAVGSSGVRTGIQLDNTGGGDTILEFDIGGTGKFILGVDNSVAGDPFKIAVGSALGTNDALAIDSSGNFVIGGTITGGTYNTLSIIPLTNWIYLSGDGTTDEGLDIIIPITAGNNFYYGYGGTEHHKFGNSSQVEISDDGIITAATGTFGTGDVTGGLTVNAGIASINHLTLDGVKGIIPARRGGSAEWKHGDSTTTTAVKGYTYVNTDGEFIWDSSAQAAAGSDGVAKVSFSTGFGTFGGLQIGSTTPQSSIPILVTAENYYSGSNQSNFAGSYEMCFSGSANSPILYGLFGSAFYDGVDPTGTGNIYGLQFSTGINSGAVTGGTHNFSNIEVTHLDAGDLPAAGIINLTGLKIGDSPIGYTGGGATVNSVGIEIGDISGDTAYAIKTGTGESLFGANVNITGGLQANLVTKTGAYTATASDFTIICNASGGAFTITLPAVASHTNRIYHIKKIDSSANAATVDGNGAETIDGGATAILTVQYESITIQSDGSNWHIL